MPQVPLAKILPVAFGQVLPQQTLDRIRYLSRGTPETHWLCKSLVLAHRAAQAEVERVDQRAILLDLFALQSNIGNPMLSATVRAARHMQSELLIELRQPLLKLFHQPAREPLRLRDCQLAELGPRAGH